MFWKINALVAAAGALFAKESAFVETLYSDWGQTFTSSREILREKTDFQDLVIFENALFGRVLMLDGVVQLTEADEPIYHEMMTHVPLLAHGKASSVLVIGGGDGGILREVLKHSSVKRVVLVEIDSSVIALSKKYFPKVSNGAFEDSRVEILIQDAAEYVKSAKEQFDVILCDSTDPVGPGEVLFTSEFYGNCKKRLQERGIFVNQNGVPFLQKEEISLTLKNRSPHFRHVGFYVAPVPTYAGGFMAFGWASDRDYEGIDESLLQSRVEALNLSFFYYTPKMHKAAFALPQFVLKQMYE